MEDILLKLDAVKGMAVALVLIGVIAFAIVERVKAEAPLLKSYWYTIISMGIGAALFAVFVYAPVIVLGFVFVGLLASGIFDITKYVSGKSN